jgi:hypothetical protein
MVTKEIENVKFSTGFFSIKNYTQKMIENPIEISDFVKNSLFEKRIEQYFDDNEVEIKLWIESFKKLTGIDTTSIFEYFKLNFGKSIEAINLFEDFSHFGFFNVYDEHSFVVDQYLYEDGNEHPVGVYLKDFNFELSTKNFSNKKLIEIVGKSMFLELAELQKQYILKTKIFVNPDEDGVIKNYSIRNAIRYGSDYREITLEILNLVLLWSSDGMNKSIYYSINNNKLETELSGTEDLILLTNLSKSEKYKLEFLEAVYSKNEKDFFNYLESRILTSLKVRTKNILNNKLTLKKVKSGDIPLSLLTDNQILESFRNDYLKVSDLGEISSLTCDEKQFNRMMELLELFIEDL